MVFLSPADTLMDHFAFAMKHRWHHFLRRNNAVLFMTGELRKTHLRKKWHEFHRQPCFFQFQHNPQIRDTKNNNIFHSNLDDRHLSGNVFKLAELSNTADCKVLSRIDYHLWNSRSPFTSTQETTNRIMLHINAHETASSGRSYIP